MADSSPSLLPSPSPSFSFSFSLPRSLPAPQTVSPASSANPPASTVNQSRIPTGGRGTNVVNSARWNQPFESSGTPRITLPSAVPNSTGSSALESISVVSQNRRHKGSATWLLSSIATARRIRHQITRKIAR